MKKAEHCFGEINMTWKLVILLSLLCGVVIGALMIPAPLKDSSFQSPGVNFEFWIFAALFIILNCKKPVEAGLKTFVFFLISQPIIYLIQVPFYVKHWGIFQYYPYWFALTVACLPGGMIAWFVKKGNVLSVLIMAVADGLLAFDATSYIYNLSRTFPKMILAILFCLFQMVFFTLLLFKKGKMRLLSFILCVLLLAAGYGYEVYVNDLTAPVLAVMPEGEAPYTVTVSDERFTVTADDNFIRITYKKNDVQESGESVVTYQDAEGNEHEFTLIYGDGTCNVGE